MQDERIKQVMCDFGFPNSHSLFYALKQVACDVAQEYSAELEELREFKRRSQAALAVNKYVDYCKKEFMGDEAGG